MYTSDDAHLVEIMLFWFLQLNGEVKIPLRNVTLEAKAHYRAISSSSGNTVSGSRTFAAPEAQA